MNNLFFKARLKLTGLYVAIIIILLFIFSQIIYISVSNNIKSNTEGDFVNKEQQIRFVQKQIDSLRAVLVSANIIVLLIVGGLSYFLAGKTLLPVEISMEQQKQFLSDASHELRTPLAILQINLDNILSEKKTDTKDYKDALGNMEEVERMTSLVNELLLLSRLDISNTSISLAKLNVTQLVQNVAKRLIPYAKAKKLSLDVIDVPPKPIMINGNAEMLSQAIGNVLKNAVDYNRINGNVFVSLEKKRETAVITVRDTGFGISPKHLPYVFHRFYKGEESRSKHKGTGLGLAIAESIIKKHNGTITIESTSPKGTTVNILFPIVSTS